MDVSTWFAGFHVIQLALTGLVGLSGPPFALSIVGTLGWVAAVGALALAARRQGAPRREWILIALAAVFLLGGHPFPAGTLAFGCLFVAALLHEFGGVGYRRPTA